MRALQPSPKGVSGVPPHSVDGLLRASARRFGRLTTSAHPPRDARAPPTIQSLVERWIRKSCLTEHSSRSTR